MRKLLTDMGDACRLSTRDEVFETYSKVHQILKEQYFLNTKEDEDDPYESSQLTSLVANPAGIFGVYSYREVFSFERFWGIGSGRNFALGAMYAVYERAESAQQIAEIGVKAGAEFDKSSAAPFQIYSFPMK
jgi:ATP-dependent protease HslVU (ClpYQ) peptidase subunit